MTKNKIASFALAGALALGLASCSDWLDLRPESEMVLEDFWKNEDQVKAVLTSCYSAFAEDSAMEHMIVWGEVRSDNWVQGNSTRRDLTKVLDVNLTASNLFSRWGSMYTIINYCNTFLYYAPGVMELDDNFTEYEFNAMKAEVLTLRSLAYFYLIRAYKEVPWIDTPSQNDAQNYDIPKSTERELLDYIIADLRWASRYAPTTYADKLMVKGRVTQNAVKAILADVYLWDQQYANCVDMCNAIIADKQYELVDGTDVLNKVFFKGNSSESIFELQFDEDEQFNNMVKRLYGNASDFGQLSFPNFLAKGDYSPFEFKVGNVTEGAADIRANQSFLLTQNGTYRAFKYVGALRSKTDTGTDYVLYASASYTFNWIFYRLSDIMLMKAEALVQLGRDENDLREALKIVNTTYLRSSAGEAADSLSFTTYGNKPAMEELVLRERQRELLFEGKRWFDLMRVARRNGTPDKLLSYVSHKFSDDADMQYEKMSVMDALYFPIHQSELNANSALVQNPYYDVEDGTSVVNK